MSEPSHPRAIPIPLYDESGLELGIQEPPIGSGSFALVHTIVGDDTIAAKLFVSTPNLPLVAQRYRGRKIASMTAMQPPSMPDSIKTAWPVSVIRCAPRDDCHVHIAGYLMPKAPEGTVTLETLSARRAGSPEAVRAAQLLDDALAALHRQGIVFGDVSGRNAALDPDGNLWLYDTDGWQFTDTEGRLHYAQGATVGYLHPLVATQLAVDFRNCADRRCPYNGIVHSVSVNCHPRRPAHDKYAARRITKMLLNGPKVKP